jgi:hypothetical protein
VALLDVANPKHPVLMKEVNHCGGRAAMILPIKDRKYLVCDLVVFSIRGQNLASKFTFVHDGSTISGFPYHCDTDGNYAALPLDEVAIVLRLKKGP